MSETAACFAVEENPKENALGNRQELFLKSGNMEELNVTNGEFAEIQTVGIEGIEKDLLLETIWEERFEADYAAGYGNQRKSLGPERRPEGDAAGSMQTTLILSGACILCPVSDKVVSSHA